MKTSLSAIATPLWVLLLAMIVFGIGLRFWDLGFPSHLTWDEHHFVENARNYLLGKPDWNDHPPLGKLLMALSLHWFEDSSYYFRLPQAVLGTLALVWGGLLARRVFGSARAGLLAAAFLACDGFLISYSRTGLLDGMLTSLSLLVLLLLTLRHAAGVLGAGMILGCALSIKLSAVTLLGPLLGLFLLHCLALTPVGKKRLANAQLFGRALAPNHGELFAYLPAVGVAGVVYLAWWRFGLSLTGKASSWQAAVDATTSMMSHHAQGNEWLHPLLSHWWTWPVPTKPLMLSYEHLQFGQVRVMTTMGNPLLWWCAVIAFLYAAWHTLSCLAKKRTPEWGYTWLALGYLAYLSPWILTDRDSYIYHYLPSYALGLVLAAGLLSRYLNGRRLLYATAVIAVVSAFYAPTWSKRPMTKTALSYRPLVLR